MNLLADEGMERQVVERLRRDGHTVQYVAEMEPGISDDDVLDRANHHSALLITLDKDFGELVFRLGRVHHGVVLVRLEGLAPEAKAAVVSLAVSQRGAEMEGCFTVISPGQIRIRNREYLRSE